VGYVRNRVVSEGERDGMETVRVTDWEPLEVSLVTVPADYSVGVGRTAADNGNESVVVQHHTTTPKQEKVMSEENNTPVVNVDAEREAAIRAERKRVNEIDSLARTLTDKGIAVADEAAKAKADGLTVDAFRASVIDKIPGVRKATPVDLPKKELRKYSLMRAIQCARTGKLDGFEGEVHNELLKNRGTTPAEMGILVPSELFGLRSMTAGTATAGAELVQEQYGDLIDKLDNMPLVRKAGARQLSGLVGDLVLPRVTGGATAYWVGETASVTASDMATDTVKMTPHRLGVLTKVSAQLAVQSIPSVEMLVRSDIAKRIEIALDLAAFQGTGAAGEPKGIFANASVNTNTYGAAATMALVAAAVKELLTDNVTGPIVGFIDPTTWGKWVAKSLDTGSGKFLWEGGLEEGIIAPGFRGYVSNHLPSNKSVFGNFSDLLLGSWESANLIVDPYTSKHQGLVEIYGEILADIAVRHAESFVISTDSAAQ
jgi:HK97 family phage major capsid protein